MIAAITIENFKGISEPVTIEFKPITLLFGANSAGKSTVFHALYYLRNILNQVGSKQDKVIYYDYGDFVTMIHNNDPTKDINITLNCQIASEGWHFWVVQNILSVLSSDSIKCKESLALLNNISNHMYSHLSVRFNIGFGIIADYDKNNPVIKHIEIELLKSKIIVDYATNKIVISRLDNLLIYFSNFMDGICGCSDCDNILSDMVISLKDSLQELNDTLLDEMEYGASSIESIARDANNDIVITYSGKPFDTSDLYNDTYRAYKHNPMQLHQQEFLLKFINIIFFGIFDNIIDDLNKALYIRPLRDMPSRKLEHTFSDDNLHDVNRWLGPSKFDTGLYFDIEKQYSISLTNQEFAEINKINKKELIERISVAVQSSVLKRIESNKKIDLSDVGFGISQLLPIIDVYTKNTSVSTGGHSYYSYVFVEQPELHLHPRMQTVLGDLIISWCHKMSRTRKSVLDDTKNNTMIETHSEHLLLRLLRRIRETTDEELPEGCDPLTPEQLAIYYMERNNGVVCARKLEVSLDGDSLGEWPKGFFEERARELF